MGVCDRIWCDFIIFANKKIHIEGIEKDVSFRSRMLELLKAFYFFLYLQQYLCPENKFISITDRK